MTETVTVLQDRPSFVVEHEIVRTDSFRGETWRSSSTMRTKDLRRTQKLGKSMLVFTSEHVYELNGQIRERVEAMGSPDMPGHHLWRRSTWYDEGSEVRHVTVSEVVRLGCSPDEAEAFCDSRAKTRPRRRASLDSPLARANIALLMEQGFTEGGAHEIVRRSLRNPELYDQQERETKEVEARWAVYRERPSQMECDQLLGAMQGLPWTSFGFTNPRTEAVLLKIAQSHDAKLRIRGYAELARMCPTRYAKLLEDLLIREKAFDERALTVLAEARFGNPRCVMAAMNPALDGVSVRLLTYAPAGKAVPELMVRYAEAHGLRKPEVLQSLTVYDSEEVRELVATLAAGIAQEELTKRTPLRGLLLPHVVNATSSLRIAQARDCFLKWLRWGRRASPPESELDAQLQRTQFARLIVAALRLRDDEVNAAVEELLQGEPPQDLAWPMLLIARQPELAEGLSLAVTPQKIEELLAARIDTGFGPMPVDMKRVFLSLLANTPTTENLQFLLHHCLPEYSPRLDLKEQWLLSRKDWYQRRMSLQPLRLDASRATLEVLFGALPSFGEEGTEIIRHLYDWPPFRKHVLIALRKVKDHAEVLRMLRAEEEIARRARRRDDDAAKELEFHRGLTLWCCGDTSRRAEHEAWLKYPRSNARRVGLSRALRYLPRTELVRLVQRRDVLRIDKAGRLELAVALSYHRDGQCARLLPDLWREHADRRDNPKFGECVNRMAKRNFGLRQKEIEEWVRSLE